LALAVGELQASLSVDPDQEETWNYLVLANLAQGAYADAARHAEEAMARGGSVQLFGGLRTLADSAARAGAPPGSIRIRVVPGPPPQ
jgi:predicted Zn-dependent protease